MKTYLTKAIACAIVITSCFSCSVESTDTTQSVLNFNDPELNVEVLDPCSGDNPTARLTNNGTVNIDLEIYSMDGVLMNHEYDITPGSTTTWKYFVPGETMFSVSNWSFEDEKVIYTMGTCMEFDMEVAIDNKLTNAIPVSL